MRNTLLSGILTVFCISYQTPAIAQTNASSLHEITAAVKNICLHPDRKGNFLRIEGEAQGGLVVKLIGANISGTITKEDWEGISQRVDEYKTDPRECSVQVLPMLLQSFRPRDASNNPLLGNDDTSGINSCIREKVSKDSVRPFSIPGRVRCPGGGCLFRSGSCNRRNTTLRYEAVSGYYIDDYEFVQGGTNHANTGHVRTEGNISGRTNKVSIELSCDPPDYPGAPGGWNEGELRGTIRFEDIESLGKRAQAECAAEPK